jgi:hypothetical protein
MKVTILTYADYAGSGLKVCEAIKRHTNIDIEIYAQKQGYGVRRWGIPATPVMTDRKAVQKRICESDVIHLKGDWPPSPVYAGMRIHDNIVTTVSGSSFRKKQYGGYGTFAPDKFAIAKVRTSFEPDLLYPEYGNIWTPHPIDCTGKKNVWQYKGKPVLMHTPSNRVTKDTKFLLQVFDKLKDVAECVVIEEKSHDYILKARQRATIFFDQFLVGFYGNTAIEAMQYGIPTANWISPMSVEQGFKIKHPIITYEKDVDKWVTGILQLIKDKTKLEQISKETYDYVRTGIMTILRWRNNGADI